MISVYCVSLGCAKNRIDTEMILASFPDSARLVDSPEQADLILINTCAFIADAKKESIQTILELSRYKGKVAVVGCLAERYYDEIKQEMPEIDCLIPIKDYGELQDYLSALTGEKGFRKLDPLKRVLTTGEHSAYLRISDGCDNFCSFCAIPYIRGRFKSRPYGEIIEEARILRDKGVKEISLISQDTTVYGRDFPSRKPDIVDLLKELDGMGFYSIRLLYLYPSEISDELIDLIASSKSIAHYFDIPVQCASDHLLHLMNRHGDAAQMRELFAKIRKKCPDAVLRTTLIAGFPGENEADQEETIEFLKSIRFDHMGCFTYSREEGTAGYSLPDQIPEKLKKARRDELMKLQSHICYEINKSHVGQLLEGMVVGKRGKGTYEIRTYLNAPDDIDGSFTFTSPVDHKEGDIVKVRVTGALVYDLMGEEVLS